MDNNEPDLLYGLDAISGHLGMTSRQAKYRALTGRIPTFKIERTVCARRSTLNAWLAQQEAKALSAPPETVVPTPTPAPQPTGGRPSAKQRLAARTGAAA